MAPDLAITLTTARLIKALLYLPHFFNKKYFCRFSAFPVDFHQRLMSMEHAH